MNKMWHMILGDTLLSDDKSWRIFKLIKFKMRVEYQINFKTNSHENQQKIKYLEYKRLKFLF